MRARLPPDALLHALPLRLFFALFRCYPETDRRYEMMDGLYL